MVGKEVNQEKDGECELSKRRKKKHPPKAMIARAFASTQRLCRASSSREPESTILSRTRHKSFASLSRK